MKTAASFPVSRPRGTQDILPADQKYWEYVVETAKTVLHGWGFQRIDTPLFEEMSLFERAVGEETDIVSKEMFELKSRGSGHYVLRPEGTAATVRAYIEHGMRTWPQPVKLFYAGPLFRYERPQKGRLRQHHQIGAEVFGSAAAITDAELIYIVHGLFRRLGLEEYVVQLNTLGETDERSSYIKLLKEHYRRNRQKLCKDCKERLVKNPLRLLDCKEEKCQQLANTAPRLLDYLGEASKQHFEAVLTALDKLGVPYKIEPSLVRGLDYYTHTVWEFIPKTSEDVKPNSVSSGGRYNKLVKTLGGKDTPAVGFGCGIERVIERLQVEGVELTLADAPQVVVAQLGERAKYEALKLLQMLQENQIPFVESIDRNGMQSQLRVGDRYGVRWALIIGQKEVLDKTIIFRNMESGMQEIVTQDNMVAELKRRLNL